MAKFTVKPTTGAVVETFRMGTKSEPLTDQDKGKAVALVGDSQVDLAGDGDQIIGFVSSIESGTQDGYKIGGVQVNDYALADTGSLDVGDYVVAETNPAKKTAGKTKVKKYAGASSYDPDAVYGHRWQVVSPGVVRRA